MNDLFRAIFGFPQDHHPPGSIVDRPPEDFNNDFRGNGGDDGDDENDEDVNMNMGFGRGIFGFPLFSEPIEIQKQLNRIVNDMNKAFGGFGFNDNIQIVWEDENNSNSTAVNESPSQHQESLRDMFLKNPECSCDQNIRQNDLNLSLRTSNFEPGVSESPNPTVKYSKLLYFKRIQRPDGSVETIKKVLDHTGQERTTITKTNINDPVISPENDQLSPEHNSWGISFLKKFFPF